MYRVNISFLISYFRFYSLPKFTDISRTDIQNSEVLCRSGAVSFNKCNEPRYGANMNEDPISNLVKCNYTSSQKCNYLNSDNTTYTLDCACGFNKYGYSYCPTAFGAGNSNLNYFI